MRTISALNFKGGTFKTTVVQNLGHALARSGARVLLIDGDRQSNLTTVLLKQRVSPALGDVLTGKVALTDAIYEARPNLFLVPSESDLDHAATYLKDHHRAYYSIRNALAALTSEFDFVLIDQAPSFTPVMDALLIASDEMLIPCLLEPFAVRGLFDMFDKLSRELGQELANAGIIPCNLNRTRKITEVYLQELLDEFEGLVLDPIHTDVSVVYAQDRQLTVFEYAEAFRVKSKAAEDFARLAHDFSGEKGSTHDE